MKRYSSGMQIRLAFAVAAHLEPELLIVTRCWRWATWRSSGSASAGSTTSRRGTDGALRESQHERRDPSVQPGDLARGRKTSRRRVRWRMSSGSTSAPARVGRAAHEAADLDSAPGNELIRLCGVRIKDHDGRTVSSVDARHPMFIEIEYEVLQAKPLRTGSDWCPRKGRSCSVRRTRTKNPGRVVTASPAGTSVAARSPPSC